MESEQLAKPEEQPNTQSSATEQQGGTSAAASQTSKETPFFETPEFMKFLDERDRRLWGAAQAAKDKEVKPLREELSKYKKHESDKESERELKAFMENESIPEDEVRTYAKAKKFVQEHEKELEAREIEIAKQEEEIEKFKAERKLLRAIRIKMEAQYTDEQERQNFLAGCQTLANEGEDNEKIMRLITQARKPQKTEEKPKPRRPDSGPSAAGGSEKLSARELIARGLKK